MRTKGQTIYDLNTDQFKYLKREENIVLHRVDINDLNKKLNQAKRSNFYRTAFILMACFSLLSILCFIGIKF